MPTQREMFRPARGGLERAVPVSTVLPFPVERVTATKVCTTDPEQPASPALVEAERIKRQTKRDAIRRLLLDGAWHSGAELERVGGRRFGGRVHELRRGADGFAPMFIITRPGKPDRGEPSDSMWRYFPDQTEGRAA